MTAALTEFGYRIYDSESLYCAERNGLTYSMETDRKRILNERMRMQMPYLIGHRVLSGKKFMKPFLTQKYCKQIT